ncbi:hypothetical protein F4703DRAFT_1890800 [Phycomyces blakesleeanus]
MQEAYMYAGNRNSADLDTIVGMAPVMPDQKPLSSAPMMQIPTTLKNHRQNDYGGEDAMTFALEIPSREQLPPYNSASSFSGIYAGSPGMMPSASPSSLPYYQHPDIPRQLEPETNLKKLLKVTNTLLRQRSRTNTMNSLGIDTSQQALLEAKQTGSSVPFRRNSLTMSSPLVDGGGGTLLSTDFAFAGSDNEDDDPRKWDKSPRNLLNFLGGNTERPTSTFLGNSHNHFSNEESNILGSNGSLSGKGESTASDEDAHEQRIRMKRTDDLRTRERTSAIRRRLSMSGVSARPIRARTQSLMRNAPITTATVDDNFSSPDTPSSPPLADAPIPHITNNPHNSQSAQDLGRMRSMALASSFSPRHRRAASVPLSIELDAASLEHIRRLLRHMLNRADPKVVKNRTQWEEVLINLLLKVSDNVNPDIRGGDEIDIRHYVKVKKIAGGQPKDSLYVKGVVCTKNVAHKHMVRTVTNPQILILLFPLEWSRDTSKGEQQLQPIDPVLAQEKDYLEKLVNRIIALKPSIVLVSSNVSRLALDFLVKANIVVVYNVKLSVLDAVARCTGASIIPSFIQLNTEELTLGHCGTFETRTHVHEWIPNRRKTFLMFHDCPPDLGATIILRGGRVETLRVIKRILDFMVFVVHNLKLESFLMRDFAKMRNVVRASLPTEDKEATESEEKDVNGVTIPDPRIVDISLTFNEKKEPAVMDGETLVPKQGQSALPVPANVAAEIAASAAAAAEAATAKAIMIKKIRDMESDERIKPMMDIVTKYKNVTLSASPMARFPPPYLLLRLKETQMRMIALIEKGIAHYNPDPKLNQPSVETLLAIPLPTSLTDMPAYIHAFEPVLNGDLDYHQILEEHHHRWRALEACIDTTTDTLSPFFYQQLVVLSTSICTETTVPCQGPEMRLFEYYRSESDMTLGQYIVDTAYDSPGLCPSSMCDRTLLEHYRAYAHGSDRVIVQIQRFESPQPLAPNTIMTWSYCKHCALYTSLTPMSENTWKYSFGKFLELIFYQSEQPLSKIDQCPHTMYRDHVHYFGYNGLAVRFNHESIEPFDVFVPPTYLYLNPKCLSAAKDAALESARGKIARFYESIVERNRNFMFDIVQPNMVDSCKEFLQDLSRRANEEKKQMLQSLQAVYAKTVATDILCFNEVRFYLQMCVYQWDLKYLEFVRQYVRPERELRRLTASHFRRMMPAETMISMPVASLDLRTKRATEAADLPLLDVGLDEYDTNAYGVSGLQSIVEQEPDAVFSFKQQPLLGESPTTAAPWLEEEIRFESLLQKMHDDQIEAVKRREAGDKDSINIDKSKNDDDDVSSQVLDPSVARRLSLELMKDNPIRSASWQESVLDQDDEPKIKKVLPKLEETSILGRHAGILTLISADACKRVAVELLPKSAITKSKSSPPPVSNHISTSQFVPEASRTTTRRQKLENERQKRIQSKQSSEENSSKDIRSPRQHPWDTTISPSESSSRTSLNSEVPVKKELPLSGYRYGYKGSTERGSTSHNRTRPRVVEPFDKGRELDKHNTSFNYGRASSSTEKPRYGSNSGMATLQVPLQVNRSIRFSKNLASTLRARNARQNLPSKSSIEVYKTIKDIVREESDDEFQATDIDDQTDVEDDDERYTSMSHGFSLTRTDEYDESLGRETDPPHIQQLRRFNREQFQMFSSSLPHLSLDLEDTKPTNKALNDPLQQTISDFRLGRTQSGSTIETAKTGTLTMIDSTNTELSSSGPERNSFIKTITNMLAEKGLGNLVPLEYPLSPIEHIFPGSNIIVGEDEPSTIIAFSLDCSDYREKLKQIRASHAENSADNNGESHGESHIYGQGYNHSEKYPESYVDDHADDISFSGESEKMTLDTMVDPLAPNAPFLAERTLLSNSGSHIKNYFADGTTKFFCKIFFVEQFDALRHKCGCDESYIASLVNCCKWDSSGGKSGSVFLKTKDDRFIIKQIPKYEMDTFSRIAPAYFKYMAESFFHELPTVLCKIFGLYRIGFKNTATGKSTRMYILVMENLFYKRVVKKIFDLKGSMRNRHVQETGKKNEVLLDENMVELVYQSPLFLRVHAKEMLNDCLHNDTLFLSRLDVMDYSLLVGVDEENQELVVGIVDFIRTFTWDKKLENWVKESGILGGGGKEPTIISPRQYRLRFKAAMDRYFLMVPDFWINRHKWAAPKLLDNGMSIHHHHPTDYDSVV